jgi:hypothetical protein
MESITKRKPSNGKNTVRQSDETIDELMKSLIIQDLPPAPPKKKSIEDLRREASKRDDIRRGYPLRHVSLAEIRGDFKEELDRFNQSKKNGTKFESKEYDSDKYESLFHSDEPENGLKKFLPPKEILHHYFYDYPDVDEDKDILDMNRDINLKSP